MISDVARFPADKCFNYIVGQITSVFRMKGIIMSIYIFVDKTDRLHSVKHFIISTADTLCRTFYTGGHKTHLYLIVG